MFIDKSFQQERFRHIKGLSYKERNVDPTQTFRVRIRVRGQKEECLVSAEWSDWSQTVSECCFISTGCFVATSVSLCHSFMFYLSSICSSGAVTLQAQHSGDHFDFAWNTHDPLGCSAAGAQPEVPND